MRHPNGTFRTKEQRRTAAEERQAAWAALSPKEQLKELDRRGHKATKQRAKIARKMAEAKAPKKGQKKAETGGGEA